MNSDLPLCFGFFCSSTFWDISSTKKLQYHLHYSFF
ncbi:hypothetical protein SLEP1_g27322 [Rubroshorea leprosula]|uniref:Photosystem II protein I n=1 Tax=Rubroshorea leprosula TaxID=152421 RepID=A0AAV5JW44_9ROSI|nr:hypothetical protein SLEP1_g27322 [Rubroshorea leprosula]